MQEPIFIALPRWFTQYKPQEGRTARGRSPEASGGAAAAAHSGPRAAATWNLCLCATPLPLINPPSPLINVANSVVRFCSALFASFRCQLWVGGIFLATIAVVDPSAVPESAGAPQGYYYKKLQKSYKKTLQKKLLQKKRYKKNSYKKTLQKNVTKKRYKKLQKKVTKKEFKKY